MYSIWFCLRVPVKVSAFISPYYLLFVGAGCWDVEHELEPLKSRTLVLCCCDWSCCDAHHGHQGGKPDACKPFWGQQCSTCTHQQVLVSVCHVCTGILSLLGASLLPNSTIFLFNFNTFLLARAGFIHLFLEVMLASSVHDGRQAVFTRKRKTLNDAEVVNPNRLAPRGGLGFTTLGLPSVRAICLRAIIT